jgi:hypothetical protein
MNSFVLVVYVKLGINHSFEVRAVHNVTGMFVVMLLYMACKDMGLTSNLLAHSNLFMGVC